jgi:hypothetical protein
MNITTSSFTIVKIDLQINVKNPYQISWKFQSLIADTKSQIDGRAEGQAGGRMRSYFHSAKNAYIVWPFLIFKKVNCLYQTCKTYDEFLPI